MVNRIIESVWYGLIFSIFLVFIGAGSDLKADDSLTPLTVDLNISKIPVLNESANLSCKVVSIYDVPNTTAKIALPDGAELINGSLTGSWDLKANVPVYLNATIRFTNTGDFAIEASAMHIVDAENSWGGLKALYLTIGQESSLFTPGPSYWGSAAQSRPGNATIMPENITKMPINGILEDKLTSSQEIPSITPIDPSTTGGTDQSNTYGSDSLTVTGYLQYWTQLGDYRPSPNTYAWATESLVEVVKASDDSHLNWGYTDLNGYFSIPVENPGSDGFKVCFYAYTKYDAPSKPELRVTSSEKSGLTGLGYVWRWYTPALTAPDGVTSTGTWHPVENYQACWLNGDLQRAWRWVWFHNNAHIDAEQGTIVWFSTSTVWPHYHPGGQIHLAGTTPRSADTPLHEYGHSVMYNKYKHWFPRTSCPDPHYYSEDEDINCAWTEGWANFFPLITNNNPTINDDSGAKVEIEAPTRTTPSDWDTGPGVEGRVAGALWDLYDNVDDGYDAYSWDFGPISSIVFNSRQNNFREFWDRWLASGYSSSAINCLYQNTIYYGPSIVTNKDGATQILHNTARLNGEITSVKGFSPDIHICWGIRDGGTNPSSWSNDESIGTLGQGAFYKDIGGLSSGTAYYYRCYAQNSANRCWAGSTAKFKTNKEPATPSAPAGSAAGIIGASYSYSTSSKDPDGDMVTYTIDWGDGTKSGTSSVKSGTAASASHSWANAGTYDVRAMATDSKGASSSWSGSKSVKIRQNNPPGTPSIPAGSKSGNTGIAYSYSASSKDPDGDTVMLTFDWDDGSTINTKLVSSGAKSSTSHVWTAPGSYDITVKATDKNGASSTWSAPLAVAITTRPPAKPSTISGPGTGYAGISYSYSTSSKDPDGDTVKYTFDWGDGTSSEVGFLSSGTKAITSHTWSTAKTYAIRVKASDVNGAISAWSASKSVKISVPRYRNSMAIDSGLNPANVTGINESSSNASDPSFWYSQGELLLDEGDCIKSLQSFEKALSLNQELAPAWNGKGVSLAILGRLNESCESYGKALLIDQGYADAWYNKGLVLYDLGRYNESAECFDRAISLDPGDDGSWYEKSISLKALGNETGSQAALAKAVELGFS